MGKTQKTVLFTFFSVYLTMISTHPYYHPKGYSQNVLSPVSVDQWENTDVNLTCTCTCLPTDIQPLKFVVWYQQHTGKSGTVTYDKTCTTNAALLLNSSLYTYGCSEELYNLTLKNISRQNEGDTWACRTGGWNVISNNVTIRVKVQVRSLTISPNEVIHMNENSSTFLNCTTTPCRPEPTFRWYASTSDVGNPVLLKTILPSGGDSSIQMFKSSFSLVSNRSVTGWKLYCEASNGIDVAAMRSKEVTLDVYYPPEIPTRILGVESGSVYSVILGDHVNLTCSVTGGNPLSQLEWNTGNMFPSSIAEDTVSRVVTWVARDPVQTEVRCRSTQPSKNYTAYVVINVLYPPGTPFLELVNIRNQYENVQGTIRVIENSTLTLTCTANSNPPPDLFQWSRLASYNTSTLVISSIPKNETGPLACNVYNIMVPTLGKAVRGNSTIEVYIDVLYPPKVRIAANKTIIEGENVSYDCAYEKGNPHTTAFRWINTTDGKEVQTGNMFNLTGISRTATGWYACVAENVMNSTDGTVQRGTSSGQFFLDVQYAAYILQLIVGSQSSNNVTVNENDTVKIVCTVGGNPAPTGRINLSTSLYYSEENKELVLSLFSENNFKSEFVASCYDAGEYTCSGRNTLYTGKELTSVKAVTININCAPRMSRIYEVEHEVYTSTNVPVTLSFTAVAYPPPPLSGYKWSRQINDSSWTNITRTTSKYNVSTLGLQSNLTVKNVTKYDFGLYNLTISNSIGTFSYTFFLIPAEKPTPPVKYGILGETVTDSSVTVWWEAEFNGGDAQRFIISYKMSSSDAWLNLSSIPEETKTGYNMTRTIGDLKSTTQYHILIYAENIFGSVKIGRVIVVQTKDFLEDSTNSAGSVGAAVGGAMGAAVIVILIAIVVIVVVCKRKRKSNTTFKSDDDTKDHTYHNLANKAESQYQQLSAIKEDEHGYMKNIDAESQYQQLSAVKEDEHGYMKNIGQQKVYENLRITHSSQGQSIQQ